MVKSRPQVMKPKPSAYPGDVTDVAQDPLVMLPGDDVPIRDSQPGEGLYGFAMLILGVFIGAAAVALFLIFSAPHRR